MVNGEQNVGRLALGEEAQELGPRQAVPLPYLSWVMGDSDLEHVLCEFHGDRNRLLYGLLLSTRNCGFRGFATFVVAQAVGGVQAIT